MEWFRILLVLHFYFTLKLDDLSEKLERHERFLELPKEGFEDDRGDVDVPVGEDDDLARVDPCLELAHPDGTGGASEEALRLQALWAAQELHALRHDRWDLRLLVLADPGQRGTELLCGQQGRRGGDVGVGLANVGDQLGVVSDGQSTVVTDADKLDFHEF